MPKKGCFFPVIQTLTGFTPTNPNPSVFYPPLQLPINIKHAWNTHLKKKNPPPPPPPPKKRKLPTLTYFFGPLQETNSFLGLILLIVFKSS